MARRSPAGSARCVTDKAVDPNHGWRHRFKTDGRFAMVGESVISALQGHPIPGISGRYARIAARMSTPEPYALAAETAVETARRLAKGRAPTGFQTPSGAFGVDFVLEFVGVEREDL